jgi:hypothetical protein
LFTVKQNGLRVRTTLFVGSALAARISAFNLGAAAVTLQIAWQFLPGGVADLHAIVHRDRTRGFRHVGGGASCCTTSVFPSMVVSPPCTCTVKILADFDFANFARMMLSS